MNLADSAASPSKSPAKPCLDSAVPLAFAHRGFSPEGTARENSLRAFRDATALGFTHLETDVWATRDGVPVAFHDETLDRTTDGSGRIADYNLAELEQFRIGGTEPILSIEQLVTALPQARFNLDVKDPAAVGPLADVIVRTALQDRLCLASFSDERRRATMALLPPSAAERVAQSAGKRSIILFALLSPWCVGPLSGAKIGPKLRAWLRRQLGEIDCLQLPERSGPLRLVTRRSVHRAHRLGLKVHVWTINEAERMHRLFDLGVDGVMTDRADVLAQVMRERHYWIGGPERGLANDSEDGQ
ncbi:glycerophosphodiester phosphodiesterase [Psychromicrobium xiongbiense]|uniref:glycerophosphodiester phosphodiesterase n=1 Tax=Psychromicrobium xiongbiense TaxID=3051184 RepID=UPI002552B9B6|nr:glycerophosphodiester phosphodiesterase [Psychromicrobium sp. YIM S02556]